MYQGGRTVTRLLRAGRESDDIDLAPKYQIGMVGACARKKKEG